MRNCTGHDVEEKGEGREMEDYKKKMKKERRRRRSKKN
jgi:hypothetical protein